MRRAVIAWLLGVKDKAESRRSRSTCRGSVIKGIVNKYLGLHCRLFRVGWKAVISMRRGNDGHCRPLTRSLTFSLFKIVNEDLSFASAVAILLTTVSLE